MRAAKGWIHVHPSKACGSRSAQMAPPRLVSGTRANKGQFGIALAVQARGTAAYKAAAEVPAEEPFAFKRRGESIFAASGCGMASTVVMGPATATALRCREVSSWLLRPPVAARHGNAVQAQPGSWTALQPQASAATEA